MSASAGLPPASPIDGRPLWLDLGHEPLLTFLHEPEGAAKPTAVLFVPPFGWDEMTSYRARRNWARALAAAGYPTGRFDLPGSGDSGGWPSDPGQVAGWSRATAGMIDWLRRRTGASRLAVIGIGLGGILACQAIAEGSAVDDLLLWAVPADGRTLIREHRAYARMIAAGYAPEHRPEGGAEVEVQVDAEDLVGYRMTAETAEDLRGIKLTSLRFAAPPRRVLLLDRDGIAVPEKVRGLFATADVEVQERTTDDLAALLAIPQQAQTPTATIQRSIEWLGAAPEGASPPQTAEPDPAEVEAVELADGPARVRERVVEIETHGQRLFGILTEPVGRPTSPYTAVFLSAGALRRTGVSRVWVELARRWAARGVPCLRFDQAGIGDSTGDEAENVPNSSLYAEISTARVLGIMDWLAAEGLPPRFITVGSCSGAFWGLHCAVADERVRAALMINLYAWDYSPELVRERATALAVGALRSRFWKRLLRRNITLAELRQKLQTVTPRKLTAGVGHPVERAQNAELEAAFDRLRDRDVHMLIMLSREIPLLMQFGRLGTLERLDRWPNLVYESIPSPDNLFRALPLQRQVHAALDRALDHMLGAHTDGAEAPTAASGPGPIGRLP